MHKAIAEDNICTVEVSSFSDTARRNLQLQSSNIINENTIDWFNWRLKKVCLKKIVNEGNPFRKPVLLRDRDGLMSKVRPFSSKKREESKVLIKRSL